MCESSYFDIDSILAESETVGVEVLHDCYNMDSLDAGIIKFCPEEDLRLFPVEDGFPRNDAVREARELIGVKEPGLGKRSQFSHHNDLNKGSKIEVPIWLGLDLETFKIIKLNTPKWYNEGFKKIVMADPEVTNLREKSVYYYEVGMLLAQRQASITADFMFIGQVFFERMKIFINLVYHMKETEDHSFIQKLTESELQCFEAGRESLASFGSTEHTKRVIQRQRFVMMNRKQLKTN